MRKILAGMIILIVLAFGTVVLAAEGSSASSLLRGGVLFFMPVGEAVDNPFILNAETGISTAAKAFPNIPMARIYPYSTDHIHEYVKFAAQRGNNIMVGIGAYYAAAFEKIADIFPDKHFIVIEGQSDRPNIKSILFDNYEAGFLAGIAAAISTENNRVGFIGAAPVQPVMDFKKGFQDAVKKYNPKAIVNYRYAAVDYSGFSMVEKGFELAGQLYGQGCDTLFAAAGATGKGVIDAARTYRKYAIGVDSNQDGIAKGFVVTSVIKKVDTAIVNLIQSISTGTFTRDDEVYHIGNVGLTLTDFAFSRNRLGKEKIDRIRDAMFDLKRLHRDSLASEIRGK
ncbi:MAG: hypothetical protein CVV64_10155 [Candidatus Wallbacteria bacterium HGW-Wallbacteria-1]|jgi:basic membrane protein A|uniref:ABC transporter substrate-binding protein PnrA-like domain-containing protein n=1 Tax=Candidatus Wallbacteria bacterium HGW-Wallbacteria-1 TaxID=2013854 RepID=A0A2N1PPQ7_9BACT|nr:MAG: hypothetical protein CVV64_10155 [Candidatus Wallbacteria bacterium HGW-Wallbacteria-1]